MEPQDESTHVLKLFPEELWQFILGSVDNASDYYKICASTPFFQHQLSKFRTQALFSSALEIVAAEYKVESEHFYPLRLVCKSWKRGVDRLIQRRVCEQNLWMEDVDSRITGFKFINLTDFKFFHDHFQGTHLSKGANPFLDRKVIVNVLRSTDAEQQTFAEALFDLLRQNGKHVWRFDLEATLSQHQQIIWYQRFKDMLHLLPNLKVFRCSFSFSNFGSLCLSMNKDFFGSFAPVPRLENLEYIQLSGMPVHMCEEITRENFPKLEKFGMVLRDSEDLNNFRKIPMTIPKLFITARELGRPWRDIFSILKEKFGNVLTELHINLSDREYFLPTGRVKVRDRFKLPNLKKLELHVDCPIPLDFLMGMKGNLEELDLKIEPCRPCTIHRVEKQERILKVYGHDALRESNIWTKLKKLKRFSLLIGEWIGFGEIENSLYRECTREDGKRWKERRLSN